MLSRITFVVLSGVLCASTARTALAQRETACVISSRLLNRVAAAVDGYNNGERVWVITNCSDTATVVATATSESEARRLGTGVLILGPYGAKREEAARMAGMDQQTVGHVIREYLYCWHETETSIMSPRHCDDPVMPPLTDVSGILVRFTLRNGTVLERTLPPNADVLFLKYSALEKFAFPYYQRILGLSGVAEMRAAMFRPRR